MEAILKMCTKHVCISLGEMIVIEVPYSFLICFLRRKDSKFFPFILQFLPLMFYSMPKPTSSYIFILGVSSPEKCELLL